MGRFAPKYTPTQRDALARAYLDRGIRPARRVAELATAGKLRAGNGSCVAPFVVDGGENTVRGIARAERRARAGALPSPLEERPPRDAVEELRLRCLRAADAELNRLEACQPEGGGVDVERLRQVARLVREIAALPGPHDPRPPSPGQKVGGVRNGGQTRGGLAATMLADLRSERDSASLQPLSPKPIEPPPCAVTAEDEPATSSEAETPQAWVRAQVQGLRR